MLRRTYIKQIRDSLDRWREAQQPEAEGTAHYGYDHVIYNSYHLKPK